MCVTRVWDRQSVSPRQIDATNHFFGLCGSVLAALTAKVIVKICQEKGAWLWLTEAEIITACRQISASYPILLKDLVQAGVLQKQNGLYQVTNTFVRDAYLTRPVHPIGVYEAPRGGAAPA